MRIYHDCESWRKEGQDGNGAVDDEDDGYKCEDGDGEVMVR